MARISYVLLFLLIFTIPAFTQCEHYVDEAIDFLQKGEVGNINDAAQEYENAGICYEEQNRLTEASTYYGMAAINYVAAARLYDETLGGDIQFKIIALESAANNYIKIDSNELSFTYYNQALSLSNDLNAAKLAEKGGDKYKESNDPNFADMMYDIALQKYQKLGLNDDSERIINKMNGSSEDKQINSSVVLLFWTTLFIILIIILISTILSVTKGKKNKKHEAPIHFHIEEHKPIKHVHKEVIHPKHEHKEKPKPIEHIEPKKKNARERATDKLRKKYSPK